MKFGQFFAVPLAGLYMFAAAAGVSHFTPRPHTNIGQIKECVTKQFQKVGFIISSSAATRLDGHVAGHEPAGLAITVDFNVDNTAHVVLNTPQIVLPIRENGWGLIQELTDNITEQCLPLPSNQSQN